VSARVAIVASSEDGELAGLSGGCDWGEAWTGAPDELPAGAAGPGLLVALGRTEPPSGYAGRLVRWLEGAAPGGREARARVIAQDGSGLWRRAPWPVNDRVFELAPPAPGAAALVVSASEEQRAALVTELAIRGLPGKGSERLTLAGLRAAAAVLFVSEPGAPLAACAMAVPAAGRVLVSWRPSPSFGLLRDIDYFDAATPKEAVQYADGVLRRPSAYDRLRHWGRLTAERHRASLVYGRLAADLELEEAAASA
jgi:hypothetical protein